MHFWVIGGLNAYYEANKAVRDAAEEYLQMIKNLHVDEFGEFFGVTQTWKNTLILRGSKLEEALKRC